MYKYFVWDFDGTLFDTYPAMVGLLKQMLEEAGFKPNEAILMREMKVSMADSLTYCKNEFGISESFIEAYGKRREVFDVEGSLPYSGAMEVCKAIATAGKLNFLYTHRGDNAIEMMDRHGLLPYFKENLTASYPFKRKPDPEGMNYLIQKYGLNPREILMIGDRELDVLAGKNAGTDACFFHEAGLINPYADVNIKSLEELFKWI